MIDLKVIKMNPSDLLLDPNNPRFAKHNSQLVEISVYDNEEVQEDTFQRMMEEFEVEELKSSIKERGFTPVDNIFIKKLNDNEDSYYVIEGNRRITAIKDLLRKHKKAERKKDILSDDILDTLKEVSCVDMTDNNEEEIDFVLGLRHHGSIKQWTPLPASFNIYKKYMEKYTKREKCPDSPEHFKYIPKLSKKVAELYSLKNSEVREKLQTYRAYLQLRSLKPEREEFEDKFSIIGDTIKNPTLREEFEFDTQTCTFSDEGVDKFRDLVIGDESNGVKRVIVGAAAGAGNLRDFAYVLSETTNREEDVEQRIYENREDPANIKADIKSEKNKRNLLQSLELIRNEFKQITLGDFEISGNAEKELLDEIEKFLDKVKKVS